VLCDDQLQRARRLFDSAGSALAMAHQLRTFVDDGEIGGQNHQEWSGVTEILAQHGARFTEYPQGISFARADARTPPMPLVAFLALLPPDEPEHARAAE
jgi:hypothetical protein